MSAFGSLDMTDEEFDRWDRNCREREACYDEQMEYDDMMMDREDIEESPRDRDYAPFSALELKNMLEKHCAEHPDQVDLPVMSNCYKLDSSGQFYPACAAISAIDFDVNYGEDYNSLFDARLDAGNPMTVADMTNRCQELAEKFPHYCPIARHRDDGGNSQLEMLWTKKVTNTENGEQREWTLIGAIDYYRSGTAKFTGW